MFELAEEEDAVSDENSHPFLLRRGRGLCCCLVGVLGLAPVGAFNHDSANAVKMQREWSMLSQF